MNRADLKVRREALGLTQGWLAEAVGVQDRAVRRWEAGDRDVPADVWTVLDEGEAKAEEILDAVASVIEDKPEADGIDVVVYESDEDLWAVHPGFNPWPASWHRAVCARIRDLTDAEVRFHYPPREAGTGSPLE